MSSRHLARLASAYIRGGFCFRSPSGLSGIPTDDVWSYGPHRSESRGPFRLKPEYYIEPEADWMTLVEAWLRGLSVLRPRPWRSGFEWPRSILFVDLFVSRANRLCSDKRRRWLACLLSTNAT